MDSKENSSEKSKDQNQGNKDNKSNLNLNSNIINQSNPFRPDNKSSVFQGNKLFGNINSEHISNINYYTPLPEKNEKNENGQTKQDNQINTLNGNNNLRNNLSQNNLIFLDESNKDKLPKLHNIVSTANLKCLLDLREIALQVKNAEYNPKRFAAVIMRIKEPKTTALIFSSGKMVCTGARTEEESRTASRTYAKIILKLGFPVKFSEFTVQNIVASCDLKFPIRLEGLASSYSNFCSYEPEMFPGVIFHMTNPKIVLLIFVSGKIVLTGARTRDDIYQGYQKIVQIASEYRKMNPKTEIKLQDLNNGQ